MAAEDGLVAAYILDGKGAGREIEWAEVETWRPEQGTLWTHLQRDGSRTDAYLRERSGLDPLIVDALLADETRPRVVEAEGGLLVILRGVNLNPGADPEDMVSLRMWIDELRIVTVRVRRLMAVQDLRDGLAVGKGPAGPGDFLVGVASRLIERMQPVIGALDERIDTLEEEMLTGNRKDIRQRLIDIRQQAIIFRRYLAPQRDVAIRLMGESHPWMTVRHKGSLREVADRVIRYVEELDSIRERAGVVQDELINRVSEQMNRTMYILTVVATIMLPLGFLTGLLGINVGGIPGAESPWGFIAVCIVLLGVVAIQVMLFRKLRWI